MNNLQYLAIMSIFLLSIAPLSANSLSNITTLLTLDPIPPQVAEGDEVSFTGTLRAADAASLPNMTVRIVEQRATESIVLATVMTDEKGAYKATWIAQLEDPTKEKVRLMTISAVFDGDDKYSASKSSIAKLKIAIKDFIVIFNADKERYNIDEVAKFTIKFFDRIGPIDPDRIIALYDGIVVNMTRVSEGLYIYKTQELRPKVHTLEITAEKHGYKPFDGANTIIVLERQPGARVSDEDFIPPVSSIVIDALYNGQTNWYYGRFPVAIFNATDQHFGSPSGIFHIVVQYMSKFGDERCANNICYLQPGENMTLSRYNSVNDGQIMLRWFAKDSAGNIEKPNKLAIYVDTVAPKISVLNIRTEANEDISIGSHCDQYKVEERSLHCAIIRAYTMETLTFQILVGDQISGVKSTYYRVVPYSSVISTDWQILETDSGPFPHSISFNIQNHGTYKLQLKAEDVAGNESSIKEFVIRITRPLKTEFPLSIADFDVAPQISTSGSFYYSISAVIKNNMDDAINGSAILLVQQQDGITEYVETTEISIGPNGKSIVNFKWIPERTSPHKIKMFIWDNGAKPLASQAKYITT
ncbi:MAG: hypothetical protein ACE5J2_06010 [Nitrososphaerales archaeon]